MKHLTKRNLAIAFTLATAAIIFGFASNYACEQTNKSDLMIQNLEALATSEGTQKKAVYCVTIAAPDGNIFPWYNGRAFICSNGRSPDAATANRLQRPLCTSRVKKNASGSSLSESGYCIPLD